MGKGIIFVSSALAATAGLFVFAACSDSESSTFDEKDSGFDETIGHFDPDTGGSPSDDGGGLPPPPACEVTIAQQYEPTWNAPAAKQDVCAEGDAAGYFDACIATLGASDGPAKCKAWTDAHAACAACIEPENNSGPVQWYKSRNLARPNIAGCIALEYGEECGKAFSDSVMCRRDACLGCIPEPGLACPTCESRFETCLSQAGSNGVCSSYRNVQESTCQGYRDAGSPALECLPKTLQTGQETPKEHLTRLVGFFCGP